jgi:hypothetical protein
VSSWTATEVIADSLDRHPHCDSEVSLRCEQELHTQWFFGVATGKNPEDSNLASLVAMQWGVLVYLSITYGMRY